MSDIVLITACGAKKEDKPSPAGRLYKSPRIRYLYKKAKELELPFYILSAKYGLINSDTIIEPYNQIMTKERVQELLPQVKEKLKDFEIVVFYSGGSRKEYRELIELACEKLWKKLIMFGHKNMGDIGKTEEIIKKLKGEIT